MTDEHLARFATRMAAMRDALDRAAARLLDEAATISPFGFVRLARPALVAADPEIARRALGRVLRLVGGREHEAGFEAVTAALGRVRAGLAATLGGCALRTVDGRVSVFREARGLAPRTLAPGERTVIWDRRFRIDLPADLPDGAEIAPWGAASAGSAAAHGVPNAAARTLPALWCGTRVVRAPLMQRVPGASAPMLDWRFVGIGPAPFSYGVASEASAIMYSGERAQCSGRGRPGTPDEVKGRGP
jgi:tRNA(Ile)-lysidine synthase